MKYLYLFAFLFFQMSYSSGQVAPNFTLTDIEGNSHTLYDYLDDGKVVVLDFYAVWCSPCQANAAGVESVWETLGPDGTDEIMILGLEGDDESTDQEVSDYAIQYNCNNPQINMTDDLLDLFGVTYYPTYLVVCPDRSYKEYEGLPDEIETALSLGIELCAPFLDIQTDARLFEYNSSTTLCSDETTPNITLMNMGQDNLTSVDIKAYLNGNLESTTNWMGNLGLFDFKFVSLPLITVSGNDDVITVVLDNPNGMDDLNTENDSTSVSLESGGEIYETNTIRFELAFDNFPQETTWEFLNSIGEVVLSGGDYVGFPNFSPPIDTVFDLPLDECYTFKIYDSIGDGICCAYADPGEGYWRISTETAEVIAEGGVFTDEESALFSMTGVVNTTTVFDEKKQVKVYPNPALDHLIIESKVLEFDWQIIDINGQIIQQGHSKELGPTIVNLSNTMVSGTYIIKIETETQVLYEKLIVN